MSLFRRNQEIPRRREGNAAAPSDCFCVLKSVTLQQGNPFITGTSEKAKTDFPPGKIFCLQVVIKDDYIIIFILIRISPEILPPLPCFSL